MTIGYFLTCEENRSESILDLPEPVEQTGFEPTWISTGTSMRTVLARLRELT